MVTSTSIGIDVDFARAVNNYVAATPAYWLRRLNASGTLLKFKTQRKRTRDESRLKNFILCRGGSWFDKHSGKTVFPDKDICAVSTQKSVNTTDSFPFYSIISYIIYTKLLKSKNNSKFKNIKNLSNRAGNKRDLSKIIFLLCCCWLFWKLDFPLDCVALFQLFSTRFGSSHSKSHAERSGVDVGEVSDVEANSAMRKFSVHDSVEFLDDCLSSISNITSDCTGPDVLLEVRDLRPNLDLHVCNSIVRNDVYYTIVILLFIFHSLFKKLFCTDHNYSLCLLFDQFINMAAGSVQLDVSNDTVMYCAADDAEATCTDDNHTAKSVNFTLENQIFSYPCRYPVNSFRRRKCRVTDGGLDPQIDDCDFDNILLDTAFTLGGGREPTKGILKSSPSKNCSSFSGKTLESENSTKLDANHIYEVDVEDESQTKDVSNDTDTGSEETETDSDDIDNSDFVKPIKCEKDFSLLDVPYPEPELDLIKKKKVTLADVVSSVPHWAAQLKLAGRKNIRRDNKRTVQTSRNGPVVKLEILLKQLEDREKRISCQSKENDNNINFVEEDILESNLPKLPKYNYRKLTSASTDKLNQLWFNKYGKVFRNQQLPYDCKTDCTDDELEDLLPPRLWNKPQNKVVGKSIDPYNGETVLCDKDLIVLIDTGADGCLISKCDYETHFPNVKLSKWNGPGFISGHSSYKILGQLSGCMKFGDKSYYIRWCVVEENTIPILGMDFIEHYNVHHSWKDESFAFGKDQDRCIVPIHLSPKMVRLASNSEFRAKSCTDVAAYIVDPDENEQYIIEPAETTTGALRLFRSLAAQKIDNNDNEVVVTVGNWENHKIFATEAALIGYAYPVEEVVDDNLQIPDEKGTGQLFSHDNVLGMFKEVYYTQEKSFNPKNAYEMYTAAHKHFKANFHVNSIKSYDEYKRSKEKENVANAKIGPQLHPHETKRAREFFREWKHVFSLNPRAPKPYKGPEFEIITGDAAPVKQNPRRYAPWQHIEIERQVNEMIEGGVVSPTISPWASNLVVTKKKDGTWRVAVDYRELNAVTRKDSYALPRVDDTLDALGNSNAKLFSVVDAASGFHQIPVKEADKEKLAFVTRNGVYTYNCLPFGVSNGPAFFQRGIDDCLRGLYFKICLCLIDDIVVWSEDFNSHLDNLATVFGRLHDYGFTLKLSKCEFFMESVEFLGYVISPGCISANPNKVAAIRDFAIPSSVKGIQRFLGMVGWYRRFIKNYSEIAAPLYVLCSGGNDRKGIGTKSKGNWSKVKDAPMFDANSECGIAFEKLKLALMTEPVLRMPDFSKTFYIICDASLYGTGAILAQDHDGFEHPVHFLSKGLSKAQKNWHSYELEMLSLVRALKAFEHYVYGYTFVVITDCRALAHWNTTKSISRKVDRWLWFLQSFDIVFQHRPGRLLFTGDTLSRDERFLEHAEKDRKYLASVEALVDKPTDGTFHPREMVNGRHSYKLDDSSFKPESAPLSVRYTCSVGLDCAKICKVQANDGTSNTVLKNSVSLIKHSPKKLEKVKKLDKEVVQLDSFSGPLLVKKSNSLIRPYIPPGSFRKKVVTSLHNDPMSGHLGFDRTLQRVASRFWWDEDEMVADVRSVCDKCNVCSRVKPRKTKKAPFAPIPIHGPWTDVHLDYCELPESGDYVAVLAIVDRFTKWCELVATKNQEAITSAHKFKKRVLLRHGTPKCVNPDGAGSFKGEFDQLCDEFFIKHFVGKAYRHTPNGLCERLIRTMEQYFGFYCKADLSNWKDFLDQCQHSINSGESYATNFSPFRLNYGFEANSPLQNEAAILEGEGKVVKLLGDKIEPIDEGILEVFDKWKSTLSKDAPIPDEKQEERIKNDRKAAKDLIVAAQEALIRRSTPKNQWIPKSGDLVDVRKFPEERKNDADCRWYGPYIIWGKENVELPNWTVYNAIVGKDADFEVNVKDLQPHKGNGERELLEMDERHHVEKPLTKKCANLLNNSIKKCNKTLNTFSALDLVGKRIKVYWSQQGARGWWKGTVVDYEPRIAQHWIKYDVASDDGTQHYPQDLIYGAPANWQFINDAPPDLL